ncbi:MAG TPA: hypothetical protein DCQ30_11195, partial [Acidimicrobiaceae bacterium]|nr:hypothetical protein [Acidimicrobiaceae bacterium]
MIQLAAACPDSGFCVAVGEYEDTSSAFVGLIETMSSGTWSAMTMPVAGLNPPAVPPQGSLSDVKCPTSGSCIAVGSYYVSGSEGLIETLSSGTWSATTAPLSGLSPAAGATPDAYLARLACSSSGSCVAVGGYTDSS